MKTFKTKLGTEIPLLNLRGKDYLQVAHRVQWFREEHPDWTIITSIEEKGMDFAVMRAEIQNESGRLIAMAHKKEDKQGFADYLEKAETGAVGRALALCGYGTQFTNDLDEGERLADSPIERSVIEENSKPYQPPKPAKIVEAMVNQMQSKPAPIEDKDPWNVITEKQIKFLSVTASKNNKGGPTLWNKVKDTGKFCNFKDGRNNLTKKEFEELLTWAQN